MNSIELVPKASPYSRESDVHSAEIRGPLDVCKLTYVYRSTALLQWRSAGSGASMSRLYNDARMISASVES